MKHRKHFFNCKFFTKTILLYGFLANAALVTNAQTIHTDSLKTTAGKSIIYHYSLLPAGKEGLVRITLPEQSFKALKSGDGVKIALPVQDGVIYDLSTLKISAGLQFSPVASRFILSAQDANGEVYITCMTKETTATENSPVLFITSK